MVRNNRNRVSRLGFGTQNLSMLSSRGTRGVAGRSAFDPRALSTQRVSGPGDPAPISTDIVIVKKFNVPLATTGTTPVNVTPVLIAGALPSCVDKFRLVKMSFYGADDTSITVADLTTDLGHFQDFGTPGNMRCQLHLAPAFSLRDTWQLPASTTALYSVVSASTSILQITLEVRTVP